MDKVSSAIIFFIVVVVFVSGIWLYQTLNKKEYTNTQLASNPHLQSLHQGVPQSHRVDIEGLKSVSNEEMEQVACGKGGFTDKLHECPAPPLPTAQETRSLRLSNNNGNLCNNPSITSLCVL